MRICRPYFALTVFALIAFWPLVLNPTETLYSNTSDFLAQHVPAKYFLVRSLRETGELPLWNPEQYAGSPFVHDIQVGLFYPPHLPLYFISEPAIGPFLSWLLFAHVVLAGWLMYGYARHAGLGELAAFVAGVGFMLSPRWMMQIFLAGHSITQGLCWLPLVLLCVERAIIRRNWHWAVGGGMAYALLILGTHPQWTFYASLLIGFWPLRLLASRERQRPEPEVSARASPEMSPSLTLRAPPDEELPRRRTLLLRWLAAEAIVVAIGLALCAVQLLPMIEAAGESSRARGMGHSWSLDGAKAAATTLIGPFPEQKAESIHWETRGGIGLTWAIFAIVGARLGGRKALVPAIIAIGMLIYALGGSYFIDRLPGFSNFRMPTRMLLTLAFPIAFLAAIGVQSLGHERAKSVLGKATAVWAIVFLNVGTVMYLGGEFPARITKLNPSWWVYWIVIGAGWGLFLLSGWQLTPKHCISAAVLLMTADVLITASPYPDSQQAAEIYPPSPIINYIREHNPHGQRVYEIGLLPVGYPCVLGPGSPQASTHGVPSMLGYNPLDVARYRQFLAFIADTGESQKAFSAEFTHPVVQSFSVVNRILLNLLSIRYLILDTEKSVTDSTLQFRLLDDHPSSYDFLGGGIGHYISESLYENEPVLPRTFVVANVLPQEEDEFNVLSQLKSINPRTTALVEPGDSGMPNLPTSSHPPGPARIRSHQPNEIHIELDGRTAGLLVLTDPWYPGWVCRVDGKEVPIWKANYAFRGVMVEEGSREVVFHFEPKSYRRGKWISLITLAGVGILLIFLSLKPRSRFAAPR